MDEGLLVGRPRCDYGSEGWGFESLRARQVTGPTPLWGGAVHVPAGAILGATAGAGPNSAWLMDAATARRSPSTRCPYTSLVMVMLACPKISDTTCNGVR
jgi:hypothetical protein